MLFNDSFKIQRSISFVLYSYTVRWSIPPMASDQSSAKSASGKLWGGRFTGIATQTLIIRQLMTDSLFKALLIH